MSSSTDNTAEDKAEAGVEGFDSVVQPSDKLERIILKLKEAVTRGVRPDQTAILVSPMWILTFSCHLSARTDVGQC